MPRVSSWPQAFVDLATLVCRGESNQLSRGVVLSQSTYHLVADCEASVFMTILYPDTFNSCLCLLHCVCTKFGERRFLPRVHVVVLCPSVCLSVTSRSMVKRGITKTTPNDSSGTQAVFWCQRSPWNDNGNTFNVGAKYRPLKGGSLIFRPVTSFALRHQLWGLLVRNPSVHLA